MFASAAMTVIDANTTNVNAIVNCQASRALRVCDGRVVIVFDASVIQVRLISSVPMHEKTTMNILKLETMYDAAVVLDAGRGEAFMQK